MLHVSDLGLTQSPDRNIWEFARVNDIAAILTPDRDFVAIAEERGAPPKIIHIANCNFSTNVIEVVLRRDAIRITEFLESERGVLILQR